MHSLSWILPIILIILLVSGKCFATPKTCDALLNECISIVHDADGFLTVKDNHIKLLKEQNNQLQKSLDVEIERATHAEVWYRDPKIIAPSLFLFGFVTAIYTERH